MAALDGRAGSELFVVTYLPIGAPRGGVLICASVYADHLALYRREVVLARRLAASGFAVQRLHYRGTGHSGPPDEGLTLGSMVDDARSAAARLEQVSGTRVSAGVGLRLGALVAAGAVARPAAPLALWDPVLEGSGYFRHAYRASLAKRAKDEAIDGATGPPPARDGLAAQLEEQDTVDVLGWSVSRSLYRSASGARLTDQLGHTPRPVLAIELGPGTALSHGLSREVARWRELGHSATAMKLTTADVWWFIDERGSPEAAVVNQTADWLLAACAGSQVATR